MRAAVLNLALLALALAPGARAAADPYLVVLRDGTFVRAMGQPLLDGGSAELRLHPSGLLARIPQADIDLVATERANLPAPAPAAEPPRGGPGAAPAPIAGTFTWGGDSSMPAPLPPPPPDLRSLSAAEKAALSEGFSRDLARLLRLQKDLEEDRRKVEAERDRFDRDLRFFFNQPRLRAALAYELKEAQEELEAIERALRDVGREIRDLHLEAADRGIHLRQLSYPLLD